MSIRTFRKAKGLRLTELAAAIEVTKGYLSTIETGGACSQAVALRLEAYSNGELDAAALSQAVAAARRQPAAA
jgi:ribosome-binding protein aMBF1 (putative translation factor)